MGNNERTYFYLTIMISVLIGMCLPLFVFGLLMFYSPAPNNNCLSSCKNIQKISPSCDCEVRK